MERAKWSEVLKGSRAIPDDLRHVIDSDRRARLSRLAPTVALHGFFASVILTAVFWGQPAMPLTILWGLAQAAAVGFQIFTGFKQGDARRKPVSNTAIVIHVLTSGGTWGVLALGLFLTSGAEHDALLVALVASILCVGAFLLASHPGASLGHSMLVALGAVVGVGLDGNPNAIPLSLLLLSSVLVIHRTAATDTAVFIARRLTEAALRDSEANVRLLLKDFETHTPDWLWRTDADGCLRDVSSRFAEAAGATSGALEGAHLCALLEPSQAAHIQQAMKDRAPFLDVVVKAAHLPGDVWWSLSGKPEAGGGYRGMGADVTQRVASERVPFLEVLDPLTELPNRSMLVRRLIEARADAAKTREPFALMCIDLDNFKSVNDGLGHAAGDAYLQAVAKRIVQAAGAGAFVARLGGDEFGVVKERTTMEDMQEISDLVVDSLLAPVTVGGGRSSPAAAWAWRWGVRKRRPRSC